MPLTTKGQLTSKLWQNLQQQWLSNSQTDVLIQVSKLPYFAITLLFQCANGRNLHAHSCVLSVAMPLLDLGRPAIRHGASWHGLVEIKLTTVPGA